MADSVAAAHDGATGLEFTFDDANAARGRLDMDAVDQASAVVPLWFNPHSVQLEVEKKIDICTLDNGANQVQANLRIFNLAGVYTAQLYIREDDDGPLAELSVEPFIQEAWIVRRHQEVVAS